MLTFQNYGSMYYGRAQNLNMKLTAAYDKALEKYDVLVMPTLPYKPPELPKKGSTVTGKGMYTQVRVCQYSRLDPTPLVSNNEQ